ncbi:MAG TPA: Gfo/Idh/MocA family oxidoreductase [Planctomycetota bacterium]|nr:Gfo/Idh/MocA family oxidoreductase [Planctomycetota bacterium]
MPAEAPIQVVVVGPGMITQLQILPSLYQLQRLGVIGKISVVGTRVSSLKALVEDESLRSGFPGHSFTPYPDPRTADASKSYPDLYKQVIRELPPRQCVLIATPDQMHAENIRVALDANQHILTVKPFVLNYKEGVELEHLARQKGLMIGIEYHKRFDDRSLIARKRYRAGEFGELKAGQAHLIEKWYYQHSNFQNWCTCENSDAFTYIGCHYVDLVAFVTGLKPVRISVYSQPQPWPNGKLGYLWTDARVIWDNGAVLSVLNGFGYPDEGPGGNTQGIVLHTQNKDAGGLISHSDQFRGVKHSVLKRGTGPGDTAYMETNPDYFQLIHRGGKGVEPVGYGYRSIEHLVKAIVRVNVESSGLPESKALAKRQELLDEYDREGILATPRNSAYNELVIEAGRLSITNNAREAVIEYGANPHVRLA